MVKNIDWKNKDKYKATYTKYHEENKDKEKLYRIENKEKISKRMNEYIKNRKNSDNLYHLYFNFRCLLSGKLKKNKYTKNSTTFEILGCSYNEFKTHLENKFENWMTWDNYGKYNGEFSFGWDIDHIIPISSATNAEEVFKLNHYTNLQPLCSKINRYIKKNKIEI